MYRPSIKGKYRSKYLKIHKLCSKHLKDCDGTYILFAEELKIHLKNRIK